MIWPGISRKSPANDRWSPGRSHVSRGRRRRRNAIISSKVVEVLGVEPAVTNQVITPPEHAGCCVIQNEEFNMKTLDLIFYIKNTDKPEYRRTGSWRMLMKLLYQPRLEQAMRDLASFDTTGRR